MGAGSSMVRPAQIEQHHRRLGVLCTPVTSRVLEELAAIEAVLQFWVVGDRVLPEEAPEPGRREVVERQVDIVRHDSGRRCDQLFNGVEMDRRDGWPRSVPLDYVGDAAVLVV